MDEPGYKRIQPTSQGVVPSESDNQYFRAIRANVAKLLRDVAGQHCIGPARLLDIGPQKYQGVAAFFPPPTVIDTLDIDPQSGCTYVGDLCRKNDAIPDSSYDLAVCTEVLEHTLQPFHAVEELSRVLKPGGLLILSAPFNFRIHGPLPDCWRFTEYGLRALLREMEILDLSWIDTPERPLMPIHYTVIARKPYRGEAAEPAKRNAGPV